VIIDHDVSLIMAVSTGSRCCTRAVFLFSGLPAEVAHDPMVISAYLGTETVEAGMLEVIDVMSGHGKACAVDSVSMEGRARVGIRVVGFERRGQDDLDARDLVRPADLVG